MVLTTPQQRDKMLKEIRELITSRGMWAYIVPSSDPHMSEYLPDQYKRREAITGFTGSAGTAIITSDGPCLLWTDSRYFIQAATQLSGSPWVLMRDKDPNVPTIYEWIASEFERRKSQPPRKIGIDPAICSDSQYDRISGAVGGPDGVLLDPENLVDLVWDGACAARKSRSPAYVLPLSVCGESVSDKVNRVMKIVSEKGFSGLVTCDLSEVAWLLNIRGSDVPCVPVVYSFAVVYASDSGLCIELFIDAEVFPEDVRKDLAEQASGVCLLVLPYEAAYTRIREIAEEVKLCIQTGQANMRLKESLQDSVELCAPFIKDLTSVKNPVEQAAFRRAHLRDAVSATKLFAWLEAAQDITEYDVVEKLDELYKNESEFVGLSFETIVGFGPNSASVHYAPEKGSAAKIDRPDILLVDFGGHYSCGGTTDTTRTVFCRAGTDAEPSEEQRRCFTTVLRGHIAIANAFFDDGCGGDELDALCRDLMKEEGLSYGHGTGHGIGALTAIHSAPFYSIHSSFVGDQVVTIEPGVYIEGKFGIRIENVGITKLCPEKEGTLCFDIITRTPLDLSLIDPSLLEPEERDWVNAFSCSCREDLAPLLADDPLAMAWLMKNTKNI